MLEATTARLEQGDEDRDEFEEIGEGGGNECGPVGHCERVIHSSFDSI